MQVRLRTWTFRRFVETSIIIGRHNPYVKNSRFMPGLVVPVR